MQVKTEFTLMCGDDTVSKIIANWNAYVPAILKYGGDEVPAVLGEREMYRALEILDKSFRPSGPGAKSPAAFSLYEVNFFFTLYK